MGKNQLLSPASRLRTRHLLVCLMFLLGLPLTASAIDTVYINSQSDWTNFCSKYNDTEINVLLNCDVTINTKGYQMKKFKGTLDGQGHAFILDYKDDKDGDQNKAYYDKNWGDDSAPFRTASGTIKNLRITGTVAIRYGGYAYRMNNPLVEQLSASTLTIENCHCDVAFINTGTSALSILFNNGACIGGFIGSVGRSCIVTFNNCSFTGSFHYTDPNGGHNYYDTGGFIGEVSNVANYTNVYINNCFSYITYDDRGTVKEFSYFVGKWGLGEISANNSYGYCQNEKGETKTLTNTEKCSDFTTDAFWAQFVSNGGITRFLNQKEDAAAYKWVQTIGTDSVPRLRTFFPTSLEVFYKDDTTHETTANGWSSFISPYDISLPEGVTPYVVTGINETDKKVTVSPYSGSTARVPLLLHTDGEAQTITVPAGYYNKYNAVGYLRGAYDDLAASDEYRVINDESTFVKPTADIPAWSCYLTGVASDSYTIDTSGSVCLISSNDDWNNLCENHSGQNMTAYLATDLTLTANDEKIEEFIGTFDGQGHCITDNRDQGCLFPKAQGTIKNLRVENNYDARYYMVYYATGNLNYIDCKATSGLLLKDAEEHTITYSHTLHNLGDNWWAAYGENVDETEKVTDEQLTNGYAAYRLNDGRTGDAAVWTQTIGEDDTPQLMSKTSKEVFQAEATTREATTDHWATIFYPADIDLSSNADLRIYDDFGLAGDTLYCYENLSGQLTASMPALLYSPSGLPAITLPEAYYNKVEPTTELVGVYADTDASALYTLTVQNDSAYFKTTAGTLPAWQCYTTRAAKAIDGGTIITSKADWKKFKTRYNGRSTNARLACDLFLYSDDEPMEHFKGTFSGTTATITLVNAQAPFKTAEGMIKQITVKGIPASGSAAIVGTASGDLTLQDCNSSAGALLGYATSDTKAHKAAATNAIVYNNCLAIVGTDTLAYVGDSATAVKVTAAQLKSGELAYKLNAGRTGDAAVWMQTIGTDNNPSINSFTAKEVYEAAGGDYKLSTAGWGTLYYPTDVALTEGVKAYTVSNVEEKTTDGTTENYVVLTAIEGSTLPAYTAAILCSLAEGESTATEKTIPLATYYYNDAKEQSEGEDMAAMLYGVLESTKTPDGSYVMQNQNGTVAFYQVNTNVAQPTIPAYRCVLLWAPADDQQSSSKVNLRFDDEATGINSVIEPLLNDGAVYDLQGRRVQSLQKGQVYIKNGQKFIVK